MRALSNFKKNVFSLSALQAANLLFPLLVMPYLLRILGPDRYGAVVLAQSVVAFGVLLTEYSFNFTATQEISQQRDDIDKMSSAFWNIQCAKVFLAAVAIAGVFLLSVAVPKLREEQGVITATIPLIIGAVLFPQWFFQGVERMLPITICSVVARLLSLPLFFLFVKSAEDAWVAALIQSSTTMLAGMIAAWLIYRGRLIVPVLPHLADVRRCYTEGWPIFTANIAISVYTVLNPVVLGLVTSNTQVGIFGAADKIRSAAQGMLSPISLAAFPRVNVLMADSRSKAAEFVRKLLLLQGGLALAMSVVIVVGAPQIVTLVMGNRFSDAIPVLRTLGLLPFVVGLSNVLGVQMMLPFGLKKEFSKIVSCSAILSISLIALLAHFAMARGAAAGVLVAELFVTAAMFATLKHKKIF